MSLLPSIRAHLYSIRWISYYHSSLICIWYDEICLFFYLTDFCRISLPSTARIVCIGYDDWFFPSRSISSPFQSRILVRLFPLFQISYLTHLSLFVLFISQYLHSPRLYWYDVFDTTRSGFQPPTSSKAPTIKWPLVAYINLWQNVV